MISKFAILSLGFFLGFFNLFIGTMSLADSFRPIPHRPDYYVLDDAQLLDGKTIHAIESLLTEHDRLTNEQVMVAIFKKADNTATQTKELEKLWTHRLFVEWKIGSRHYNEGILLTIFLESGHAFFEVGYGLEPKLSESQTEEILGQTITKQLRHQNPKSAAVWGAYRILEALDSPLIQNGKAIEILRQDGIPIQLAPADEYYEHTPENSATWLILFFLGISIITFVFYQILSREADFTANGWQLDYPWFRKNLKRAPTPLILTNNPLNPSNRAPHSPIVDAIRLAEESSSGQIRVHLSKRWVEKNPGLRAQKIFSRYKMSETPLRNSILIYVNLRKKKFSILADTNILQAAGQAYWQEMETELKENLNATQNERAISFSVTSIGQILKRYFPSKISQ